MVYNTVMPKEEKERTISVYARCWYSRIARYLGMTPRMFSNLISGRADGNPDRKERRCGKHSKCRIRRNAPGMYYADMRPKRRDGRPMVGRLK